MCLHKLTYIGQRHNDIFMHCTGNTHSYTGSGTNDLSYPEMETHDWCGLIHFHTFKSSILPRQPTRLSGLRSSKPAWHGSGLPSQGSLGQECLYSASGALVLVAVGIPHLCLLLPRNWELCAILSLEYKVAHSWGTQGEEFWLPVCCGRKIWRPVISPAGCTYTRDHTILADRDWKLRTHCLFCWNLFQTQFPHSNKINIGRQYSLNKRKVYMNTVLFLPLKSFTVFCSPCMFTNTI